MATTTVLQNVNIAPGCKRLTLRVVYGNMEQYETGGVTIDVSSYMKHEIHNARVTHSGRATGIYSRQYKACMLINDTEAPSTGLKLYLQTAGVEGYTDPYVSETGGYVGELFAELEADAHLENMAFDITVEGY